MSAALDLRPLRLAHARLAELGLTPGAAALLRESARDVGETLRREVLRDVRGFSESGNPRVLPQLGAHAKAHIEEMLRLLAGEDVGDFAFVREHARLRAGQCFPLEWTTHAYRCGHRVLSRWTRGAAELARPGDRDRAVAAIADFALEYTDAISAAMTQEYLAHRPLDVGAQGDRNAELLDVLLAGYDESDARVARLLRSTGYLEQRRSYCMLAIRPAHAGEIDTPGRAGRILAALADLVSTTQIRSLAALRDRAVVALTSIERRQSGWTAPQSSLAERLVPLLSEWGPAVVVGVSADHPSTSAIPRARREAMAALDFASVERRVVPFATLSVRSLLAHAGGEYVRAAAPAWIDALLGADARADGAWLKTLKALADADLNVQQAGRSLGVHPNTVYGRLTRIRDLTGLDGQTFHGLAELLLATECARP